MYFSSIEIHVSKLFSRSVCALLIGGAIAVNAAAQQVPLRDLPKPSKEIDDPFSLINAAREIRPGQVVVGDGIEQAVTLIDFTTGMRKQLGRTGAGPGEYTVPTTIFRLAGDTVWVIDGAGGGASARIVTFLPDFKAGATTTMMLFDQHDSTIVQGAMFNDARGRIYSTTLKLVPGQGGYVIPDSMELVRFDPRGPAGRTQLGRVRTPSAGKQERQQDGTHIKVKSPYPGLVAADAWTVFSDGRVAIVRGGNYSVEFITAEAKTSAPVVVPYDRIKVTEADKTAEMADVKRQLDVGLRVIRKTLPPTYTLDVEIIPPPSWPAEYPPFATLSVLPAPDGKLWVKRAIPVRLGYERWDVLDRTGKLVARWQLPPKTSIVAVGDGSVYTVRTDDDDLRYLQRVELPSCKECR